MGFTTGIAPTHRHGAIELVVRYSRVDLTDGAIDGGVLRKAHFGVNWWASQQWKAGISYGDADLDRGGTRGNTRMLLTRFQWFY
jgi:phosphate-selective porin